MDNMLTEDGFGAGLVLDTESLDESFLLDLNDSLRRISPAGLRSEWDWISPSDSKSSKSLPYEDQPSLDRVHELGFRLYRDPNIQAAIETMVSFVVNKGWQYAVSKKRNQTADARTLSRVTDLLDALVDEVNLGLRSGWYYVLQESYRRYLRDGEFFRRWFVTGDTLSVRFIEVFDIRQPTSWTDVVLSDSDPSFLWDAKRSNDLIPGDLGVVSKPTDAAMPLGYWYRMSVEEDRLGTRDQFTFLPSTKVQHCKGNVDENDPRGVPAFYDTICLVAGIGEVNQAMNELAVKQSKYAVVHKHKATNRRESIQSLRSSRVNELNDQMSASNREPYETHMKNVDIEMFGMKTNAKNYIEVIQQGQRLTGNVRQIPEFMITGDANTGNRSSLQSAESPFGRRVSRDQKEMWYFDRELIWSAITRMMRWKGSDAQKYKRKIQITPAFPLADTRDRAKDAEMVQILLANEVISRQQAARILDVDFEQMRAEIQEAPLPSPESATGAQNSPPMQNEGA